MQIFYESEVVQSNFSKSKGDLYWFYENVFVGGTREREETGRYCDCLTSQEAGSAEHTVTSTFCSTALIWTLASIPSVPRLLSPVHPVAIAPIQRTCFNGSCSGHLQTLFKLSSLWDLELCRGNEAKCRTQCLMHNRHSKLFSMSRPRSAPPSRLRSVRAKTPPCPFHNLLL